MTDPRTPPPPTRTAAVTLHRTLLAGDLLCAAVFAYLYQLRGPLIAGPGVPLIPQVMAAVALGAILLALLKLRDQVPLPAPGQDAEAYWKAPMLMQKALLVWVVLNGAAIICLVGALLTGSALTVAIAVVALILLGLLGPGHFESRS